MVNRNIQVKIIKMRRRNRKARFDETVVNVGLGSLSHQKIGVGLRVPGRAPAKYSLNRERMGEINPRKDLASELPKSLKLTLDEYQSRRVLSALHDQDLNLKRLLFDGRKVKVFVFFDLKMSNIFLLKIDFRLDMICKSCNFRSLEEAQDVYSRGDDKVPWRIYTVE